MFPRIFSNTPSKKNLHIGNRSSKIVGEAASVDALVSALYLFSDCFLLNPTVVQFQLQKTVIKSGYGSERFTSFSCVVVLRVVFV